MQKIDLTLMTKEQKLELVQMVTKGEAKIVDGYLIIPEGGELVFMNDSGQYFSDSNGKNEVSKTVVDSYPIKMFLPLNGREFKIQKDSKN